MSQVSPAAQDVFVDLVKWEMLGFDLDPKALLRQVPLGDLSIVKSNIDKNGISGLTATESLVEAEILYRTGKLVEDWSYEKKDESFRLHYRTGEEAA